MKRPHRGLVRGQVLELIAREVGLAEAYRWVPLGDLRNDSDSDEPRETQAELEARQAEHSREHYRKLVLRRLEQEKDDPDLRTRRKDMFCWTRTSGTDIRAIIIETLREIGVSVSVQPSVVSIMRDVSR